MILLTVILISMVNLMRLNQGINSRPKMLSFLVALSDLVMNKDWENENGESGKGSAMIQNNR